MGKILLISIIVTLFIEILARESLNGIKVWIVKHTLNFIHSLIVVFATFMCFIFIMPWHHLGYIIVSGLIVFLAYANKYKKKYRGDDFFPWDFMMFKESKELFKYLCQRRTLVDLLIGTMFMALIIGYGMTNIMFIPSHFLFGACLVVLLSTLMMLAPINYSSEYYFRNGYFIGFLTNVRNLYLKNVFKEVLHWEEDITQCKKNLMNEKNQLMENDLKLKSIIERRTEDFNNQKQFSNVVFYMNESFFDVTQLEGVKFNIDPLKNLHQIKYQAFYGHFISSEFGGGTSNVEFEVLTSLPMAFLPTGIMAFKKYTYSQLPSLTNYFNDLGYETIGLHAYKPWVYKRENAYYKLGFQKFIDSKHMKHIKKEGLYISDKSLVSNIIYQLNDNKSKKPKFIYGTSMQNYGPYKKGRYEKKNVRIMNRKALKSQPYELTDDEINMIEVYAQGAYDADQSLGILVKYLKNVKTPTQVMFYGDHLPMLGEDFSIYKKLGLLKSNSYALFDTQERFFCHKVPFIIWSNHFKESLNVGVYSGNYLGVKFLELNGYKYNGNYQTVNNLSYIMPILSNRFNSDELLNNAKYISDVKFMSDTKKVIKSYKKITYESLIGKSMENHL